MQAYKATQSPVVQNALAEWNRFNKEVRIGLINETHYLYYN